MSPLITSLGACAAIVFVAVACRISIIAESIAYVVAYLGAFLIGAVGSGGLVLWQIAQLGTLDQLLHAVLASTYLTVWGIVLLLMRPVGFEARECVGCLMLQLRRVGYDALGCDFAKPYYAVVGLWDGRKHKAAGYYHRRLR